MIFGGMFVDGKKLWSKGWLKKINNIYIIKTFMPFPLKENNCYLAESDVGWAIIDTGVNIEINREIWKAALKELGLTFNNIKYVYLTHYHHDHSGLAGWIQKKSNATVYLPANDQVIRNIISDQYYDLTHRTYFQEGWPDEFTAQMAADVKLIDVLVQPYPDEVTSLYTDHKLLLADNYYNIIHVPGHTDGHFTFHSPENNILFSGDNVIKKAILHITDWPQSKIANPYKVHLEALDKLQALNPSLILPGHGDLFENLEVYIDMIKKHHEKRKLLTYEALQEPTTAWNLACRIFKPAEHDYIHIKRLVLAETLAYLNALIGEQIIKKGEEKGRHIYYKP